jgi:hypothetical protein
MSNVLAIVDHYLESGDFENARDELHALGPTAMSDVLAAASTHPPPRGLELLVMVLADKSYPPALGAFRRWLDHPDLENIAYPAAAALAKHANEQFDTDDLYNLPVPAAKRLLHEIAAWWDASSHHIPTEAEWLAQQATEQTRDAAPIDHARVADQLTPAELDVLRPQIIALKQAFGRLPARRSTASTPRRSSACCRSMRVSTQTIACSMMPSPRSTSSWRAAPRRRCGRSPSPTRPVPPTLRPSGARRISAGGFRWPRPPRTSPMASSTRSAQSCATDCRRCSTHVTRSILRVEASRRCGQSSVCPAGDRAPPRARERQRQRRARHEHRRKLFGSFTRGLSPRDGLPST